MSSPKKISLIITAVIVFGTSHAGAICKGSFLNPITDVCWQCIFPIKIGGVMIGKSPGAIAEPPDPANKPICVCPAPPPIFYRYGISLSFWEPARFIETVKDPFCFPSLGFGLQNSSSNTGGSNQGNGNSSGSGTNLKGLGGSHHENGNNEDTSVFSQAHYFIFPVWSMLELLTDFVCVEGGGLDVAYMTEVDPLWNDDYMALFVNPEALLFANPIAQFACVADAVSAQTGLPQLPLFWCMGSWGSAYPLSGHIRDEYVVQANAGIAARLIYKLARQGLLWDYGINLCGPVPTPIWVKWNYRLQIAKPTRGMSCIPIGRTGLLWSYLKNPPIGSGGTSDNFLFIIFRKRACCAF